MKTTFAALASLSALTLTMGASAPAQAQEAAASPLSFNVSVTSDYRYRGISQSRRKPALQGGADLAFANGFYLGTWGSTIQWVKDGGGKSEVEVDVYGGWKGEVASGLTLDLGLLQYYYPRNNLNPSANTLEAYGALSYGVMTVKYSASATNLFGFASSKKSGYLDVSATLDAGDGWTVVPHFGHQNVKNQSAYSYSDYSVTVTKDFGGGFSVSGTLVSTNADGAYVGAGGRDLGKTSALIALKKTF